MPFIAQAYFDYLRPGEQLDLQRDHTRLGYHPETQDTLYVPNVDRYSGLYVIGVAGSGKSGLLENMIAHDLRAGNAVIVLDPHGDLIMRCLAELRAQRLVDTFLLDMEDEAWPFGINVFSVGKLNTDLARTQAVDKIMHIFEILWEDVLSQQHLPRYVRAAIIALLANPGATLVDMYDFLLDAAVRRRLLQRVTDPTVIKFWQTQFEDLSAAERLRRVQPLIGRLESLFMGRSLIRNVVGQRRTTINIRQAIERREVLFIRLPLKTVPQDARLIGTLLMAQIHSAIFSFADVPAEQRPGVSLYIDEFQNFSTHDIDELFTQGRKFGVRLTVAHQYRSQLPKYLQESTMTTRTKVCFQVAPEDGREMAHLFPTSETTVKPEDIDPHPAYHLLARTPDDKQIQTFVETYLRPLQGDKRGQRVEIETRHLAPSISDIYNGGRADNPRWPDPTPFLDALLYQVMRTGNPNLPIPADAVRGFANSGRGFYRQAAGLRNGDQILSANVCFPPALVIPRPNGGLHWTRLPEGGSEQLYHFVFHLRQVMAMLAAEPIGKKTTSSASDVAKMLAQLPRRAALVRSGDTTGVIYTHDLPKGLEGQALYERVQRVLNNTRQRYCTPRHEVEAMLAGHSPNQVVTASPGQNDTTALSRWEELE